MKISVKLSANFSVLCASGNQNFMLSIERERNYFTERIKPLFIRINIVLNELLTSTTSTVIEYKLRINQLTWKKVLNHVDDFDVFL